MTDKTRKERTNYTPKQKHEYARLMVEEHYTNQQIMEISGACSSAVVRWKRQYLQELQGKFDKNKILLNEDKRRILELEKQLAESREDVRLLKKATALFIQDNPNLK